MVSCIGGQAYKTAQEALQSRSGYLDLWGARIDLCERCGGFHVKVNTVHDWAGRPRPKLYAED